VPSLIWTTSQRWIRSISSTTASHFSFSDM
jgi:hypothetical protein